MPLSTGDAIALELIAKAEAAAVRTLNTAAEQILARASATAPREDTELHAERFDRAAGAPYPEKQLFESGEVREAVPGEPALTAQVIFDSPYAGAQEAGQMTYESKGGSEVFWEPMFYSSPGTGPHYLEDATKTVAAELPVELAVQAKIEFGDTAGFGGIHG